ncbi:hypothetical protein BB559_007238 [Furculomyces boomerangus]|uniref:Autophagy-related protein 4 n=1 Tax=Furculomyces boomerangus TaxID=61424 RepID=A0A2T9XY79_9FUNG|nr:hypothetical protein BB559_007238 [Furculomyces boomerangus]
MIENQQLPPSTPVNNSPTKNSDLISSYSTGYLPHNMESGSGSKQTQLPPPTIKHSKSSNSINNNKIKGGAPDNDDFDFVDSEELDDFYQFQNDSNAQVANYHKLSAEKPTTITTNVWSGKVPQPSKLIKQVGHWIYNFQAVQNYYSKTYKNTQDCVISDYKPKPIWILGICYIFSGEDTIHFPQTLEKYISISIPIKNPQNQKHQKIQESNDFEFSSFSLYKNKTNDKHVSKNTNHKVAHSNDFIILDSHQENLYSKIVGSESSLVDQENAYVQINKDSLINTSKQVDKDKSSQRYTDNISGSPKNNGNNQPRHKTNSSYLTGNNLSPKESTDTSKIFLRKGRISKILGEGYEKWGNEHPNLNYKQNYKFQSTSSNPKKQELSSNVFKRDVRLSKILNTKPRQEKNRHYTVIIPIENNLGSKAKKSIDINALKEPMEFEVVDKKNKKNNKLRNNSIIEYSSTDNKAKDFVFLESLDQKTGVSNHKTRKPSKEIKPSDGKNKPLPKHEEKQSNSNDLNTDKIRGNIQPSTKSKMIPVLLNKEDKKPNKLSHHNNPKTKHIDSAEHIQKNPLKPNTSSNSLKNNIYSNHKKSISALEGFNLLNKYETFYKSELPEICRVVRKEWTIPSFQQLVTTNRIVEWLSINDWKPAQISSHGWVTCYKEPTYNYYDYYLSKVLNDNGESLDNISPIPIPSMAQNHKHDYQQNLDEKYILDSNNANEIEVDKNGFSWKSLFHFMTYISISYETAPNSQKLLEYNYSTKKNIRSVKSVANLALHTLDSKVTISLVCFAYSQPSCWPENLKKQFYKSKTASELIRKELKDTALSFQTFFWPQSISGSFETKIKNAEFQKGKADKNNSSKDVFPNGSYILGKQNTSKNFYPVNVSSSATFLSASIKEGQLQVGSENCLQSPISATSNHSRLFFHGNSNVDDNFVVLGNTGNGDDYLDKDKILGRDSFRTPIERDNLLDLHASGSSLSLSTVSNENNSIHSFEPCNIISNDEIAIKNKYTNCDIDISMVGDSDFEFEILDSIVYDDINEQTKSIDKEQVFLSEVKEYNSSSNLKMYFPENESDHGINRFNVFKSHGKLVKQLGPEYDELLKQYTSVLVGGADSLDGKYSTTRNMKPFDINGTDSILSSNKDFFKPVQVLDRNGKVKQKNLKRELPQLSTRKSITNHVQKNKKIEKVEKKSQSEPSSTNVENTLIKSQPKLGTKKSELANFTERKYQWWLQLTTNQHVLMQALMAIKSRFYFHYRVNFGAIASTRFTSDIGWGCVHRSSQMLLAEAFMRVLPIRHPSTAKGGSASIFPQPVSSVRPVPHLSSLWHQRILEWFADEDKDLEKFKNGFKAQIPSISETEHGLESSSGYYSLHAFARAGLLFNKEIGDWFSPATASQIIMILVKAHGSECPLSVMVCSDQLVYSSEVVKKATAKNNSSNSNMKSTITTNDENNSSDFNKVLPTWNPLLLLVPLRLGIEKINPAYYKKIKRLFTLPSSVGFVGGSPGKSFYFIGEQDGDLLYLDPHYVKDHQPLNKGKNDGSSSTSGNEDKGKKGKNHSKSNKHNKKNKLSIIEENRSEKWVSHVGSSTLEKHLEDSYDLVEDDFPFSSKLTKLKRELNLENKKNRELLETKKINEHKNKSKDEIKDNQEHLLKTERHGSLETGHGDNNFANLGDYNDPSLKSNLIGGSKPGTKKDDYCNVIPKSYSFDDSRKVGSKSNSRDKNHSYSSNLDPKQRLFYVEEEQNDLNHKGLTMNGSDYEEHSDSDDDSDFGMDEGEADSEHHTMQIRAISLEKLDPSMYLGLLFNTEDDWNTFLATECEVNESKDVLDGQKQQSSENLDEIAFSGLNISGDMSIAGGGKAKESQMGRGEGLCCGSNPLFSIVQNDQRQMVKSITF